MTTETKAIRPTYTSKTNDEQLTLSIELPGVLKEDTTISSEANTLKVTAVRKHQIPDDWQLINQSPLTDNYQLTLELHKDLNLSLAKASFKNGILQLIVPKHEAMLPRKIDIIDE